MTGTEQRAALEALDAAITGIAEAYEYSGVTTGFVLGVATVEYDSDGEQRSGIWWHNADGQPWHSTLGILRATQLRLEADYLRPEDTE